VTGVGRLHLCANRDPYFDTHRVLFVQPCNETALVDIGDNFEAMTSELKPCLFVENFFSGGQRTTRIRLL